MAEISDRDNLGITILHDPTSTTAAASAGPDTSAGSTAASQPVFDLVAIHGLNGDAFNTWTHAQTGVMWLRDILPTALNARVMTFGYNARLNNITAKQNLRDISLKLLAELVDVRATAEEKTRPIVFVCHSLGGIVAKKVLLIGCSEEQENIQQSVYGILFLGTPHNGSSLANMGKVVANILYACSPLKSAHALLGILQKNSEALLEITADFVKRRRKVHLISFYEMEMTAITPFLKRLIVEHQSAILNIPEEITIGQYADHRGIVRFKSSQDRAFRPVLSRLKILLESIERLKLQNENTDSECKPPSNPVKVIPLDIPIMLNYASFRGRGDILERMHDYFIGDDERCYMRRTFAICGLGGSGKTQVALRYISQHMATYITGVMFVNATSVTTLEADFSRLYDLLGFDGDNNKVTAMKSWLSKETNGKWLLVFDNADDLHSVPLTRYFPVSNSGHILITSRDQAALSEVAETGLTVGPLSSEDATELLIERSGFTKPSPEERVSARGVVDLLGALPLALIQAAAFIRSRHKSFAEYHKLFLTHRRDLLSFTSRLGDQDRAVLTAWEVNFKQVERESTDAADLLLLFSFLEPSSISETILYRGSSPRNRWSDDGYVDTVSAEDEGVDKRLAELIRDEIMFDAAMEKLFAFSLVTCNKETDGLRSFSIHPLVQYCATQRLPQSTLNRWRWQAIFLICHAFPRSHYLEPRNGDIGRAMMPHFRRVLDEYDIMCITRDEPTPFDHNIAAAILAASSFSTVKWKTEAVARVRKILERNPDKRLSMHLACREIFLTKSSKSAEESDKILQPYRDLAAAPDLNHQPKINSSYNSQRGRLVNILVGNLIRQGKLTRAREELVAWQPLQPASPSPLELLTLRSRDILLGKILRYQGKFDEALPFLQNTLKDSLHDDFSDGTSWYRTLIAGVADLYCELDRAGDAAQLLKKELDPMVERGIHNINASGRLLQTSLAETYIQRCMFEEAERLLLNLREAFAACGEAEYSAELHVFRICICLARVFHLQARWDEALSSWLSALAALQNAKLGSGPHAGIVRYSIAHALFMMGSDLESKEMVETARTNIASKPRMFRITCFNSLWQDFVVQTMDAEFAARLPGIYSNAPGF